MKKATLFIGTGLLFSAAVLVGTVANAEDIKPSTIGSVTFDEGGNPVIPGKPIKLVKPGTPDTYIYMKTGEGQATGAALRFSFIPNIKFGNVKISSDAQKYKALPLAYSLTEPTTPETEVPVEGDSYIPPFVQVIDETGLEQKFSVSAQASLFKELGAAEDVATKPLENSRIEFTGQKLANSVLDKVAIDSVATTILDGFAANAENVTTLKPDGESLIFKSSNGVATNASASSSVFDSEYKSDKADYTAAGRIANVQLNVPSGQRPKAGKTYESTITWSLTMAP